jgi:TonB family protein
MVQAAKPQSAPARRRKSTAKSRDRVFWICLTGATILHAALIVGAVRSSSRQMGEHDGDPDALSVDLVDAASLSSTLGPLREQGESTPPPAPPPQQAAEAKADRADTPFQLDPQALALFPPQSREDAAEKSHSQSQQHARATLQLTPPDAAMLGSGRSTSVGRPPNITRSGENDEFGRGVVRALRRTMPEARAAARVTIRFLLSESGNIIDLALVRSSGDTQLDQSVMFAAKQSSFPLPPTGATQADRMFLVTYIYHNGIASPQ